MPLRKANGSWGMRTLSPVRRMQLVASMRLRVASLMRTQSVSRWMGALRQVASKYLKRRFQDHCAVG